MVHSAHKQGQRKGKHWEHECGTHGRVRELWEQSSLVAHALATFWHTLPQMGCVSLEEEHLRKAAQQAMRVMAVRQSLVLAGGGGEGEEGGGMPEQQRFVIKDASHAE